jgi:hypothetical protein
MSVDYYYCEKCGESVYSEYQGHCGKCHKGLCTNCLINDTIQSRYAYDYYVLYDGSDEQIKKYSIKPDEYEIGDKIDDSGIDSKYCPYCSGDAYTDSDLLDIALKFMGITKDKIIELYKESNK